MSNFALNSFANENDIGLEFVKNYKQESCLIKSIFEFYRLAYYQEEPEEISIITQKIHKIFLTTIWCIQISSLLWIPHLPIGKWDDNKTIWEFFGYLRLDNACFSTGIINFCIYISLSTVWLTAILIVIFVILIHKLIEFPKIFVSVIKKILYILSNYLLIPTVTLLCVCLKHNFSPDNAALEYKDKDSAEDLKVPIEIQIWIIFTLIIYYIMIIMNVVFSSEIRHSMWKMKLKSKAHSNLEINSATFSFLAPIIYSLPQKIILCTFKLFLWLFLEFWL
ncbi:unnamed protein product [Blepharisma stoltei]|uniref:Uncharacterized protein n=1 Tax=Blepharisma stoltei TaxID=1481888 RepID=A0AAU9JCJ0_9CILI|nr:unnamed protein product [Blepharisma stoltei]